MKIYHVHLLVLCWTLCSCDRHSDHATSTTATSELQARDYDQQLKQNQERWDAYDRQTKHAEEQLKAQADMQKRADDVLRAQLDMHTRADALLVTQERLLKRQQDDFAR